MNIIAFTNFVQFSPATNPGGPIGKTELSWNNSKTIALNNKLA